MQKLTVPIETGGVIRQGTNYTKNPDGSVAVVGSGQTPEVNSPLQAPPPTATPAPEPERPRTLLEQWHPQLGPDKDLVWDEKTGRVRITPKLAQDAEPETEVPDTEELPPLGEQHETIVDAVTQAPPAQSNENQELKNQIGQLTQLVTIMAQAQMQGKPLAEVLGQQQQPKEPDYSEVDMYDPAQASKMFSDIVRRELDARLAQHQPTLEQARRRQEYDSVAAQHSADPNFNNKVIAAIKLVQNSPSLTIPQAYEVISQVAPATPSQQSTAATPIPAATQARTLTKEQAQAKAEQAKKLPSNTGVRGAGAAQPPAHVKELGQLIAWNLQQASLGH